MHLRQALFVMLLVVGACGSKESAPPASKAPEPTASEQPSAKPAEPVAAEPSKPTDPAAPAAGSAAADPSAGTPANAPDPAVERRLEHDRATLDKIWRGACGRKQDPKAIDQYLLWRKELDLQIGRPEYEAYTKAVAADPQIKTLREKIEACTKPK